MKKNFEVLRFEQHGSDFRMVTDSTVGETISTYIMENPKIEKDIVFQWIHQIIKEMMIVERITDIRKYCFLVPFSIILKEDGKIALLDLRTKKNLRRIEMLLEQPDIKVFFSEDNIHNDIYSFGRTLQYVFAHIELKDSLTRCEEKQIRKIISKCLNANQKKTYHNFEQISSEFSKVKRKKRRGLKLFLRLLVLLLGGILVYGLIFYQEERSNEEYLEAGLTYFVTLNNYKKSEELFSEIQNSTVAKYYREMAAYMQGDSRLSEREMEDYLKEFESSMGSELSYEGKYCMLKVYDKIDTESANKSKIELAEEMLESPEWYRNEQELREIVEQKK